MASATNSPAVLKPALSSPNLSCQQYPCTVCHREVLDNVKSIECDNCSSWTHYKCSKLNNSVFEFMSKNESVCFHCFDCLNVKSTNSNFSSMEKKIETLHDIVNNLCLNFNPFPHMSAYVH